MCQLTDTFEERRLTLFGVESLDKAKRKMFSQIHRSVKDSFAVASYRDIQIQEFDEALRFVKAWRPRLVA
ncbi:ORF6C domain-containing protein [Aureibacillus halotolerans]|uniref:ORF6C domain-containing protein n=1 Tax=Aureibacillus halotolerans TaxID=1508390 RepID=UPI001414CDD3